MTPDQASREVLLPCPFCDAAPWFDVQDSDTPVPGKLREFLKLVWCEACGAEGPEHATADQAIAAWNTRTTPSPSGKDGEYVIVPRVPTEAMLAKGASEVEGSRYYSDDGTMGAQDAWSAMIAAVEQSGSDATMAPIHPDTLRQAIKVTEYKYFGDYEMNETQRSAVDSLVEFVNWYLATAPVAPAAGVWRDIGSAPKDGTVILLGHSSGVFDGWWAEATGWVDGDTDLYGDFISYKPTHWMPLPTAPMTEANHG